MTVQMDFIVVLWVRGHGCTDGLRCSAVGRGHDQLIV